MINQEILDLITVAIVFGIPGIVAIVVVSLSYYNKIQRMKIEAALRQEEMRRGYMPGTYSRSFSSRKAYEKMMKEHIKTDNDNIEADQDEMTREDLERAISDLEKRINNLDTIMKERKNER